MLKLERHLWGFLTLSLLCSYSVILHRTLLMPGWFSLSTWISPVIGVQLQLREENLPGPSLGVVDWCGEPRCFPLPSCVSPPSLLPPLTSPSLRSVQAWCFLPVYPSALLLGPHVWLSSPSSCPALGDTYRRTWGEGHPTQYKQTCHRQPWP